MNPPKAQIKDQPLQHLAELHGPAQHLTYSDIVMNAKLQLERPMSNDPVMPESQTHN